MKCAVYVVVLATLACRSRQAKLPGYLVACSRSDQDFNKCALQHGISALPSLLRGDPRLRIPVLDPLLLDSIEVKQGSGPVRINLALSRVFVKGLKHAHLTAVNFDLNKRTLEVHFTVQKQMHIDSKYQIDGQVLILPIKGDGDFHLKLDDLKGSFKSDFDVIKKADGKDYVQFRDSSFDFHISKAIFNLENLFNGDKAIGDTMNTFLNENWSEVYSEIKPAVSEVVRTVIVRILDKVMSLVPYDDLITT